MERSAKATVVPVGLYQGPRGSLPPGRGARRIVGTEGLDANLRHAVQGLIRSRVEVITGVADLSISDLLAVARADC